MRSCANSFTDCPALVRARGDRVGLSRRFAVYTTRAHSVHSHSPITSAPDTHDLHTHHELRLAHLILVSIMAAYEWMDGEHNVCYCITRPCVHQCRRR
jgi:hypothetical protein